MSHLDPKRPATKSELRSFAYLVGAAFAALAALLFWRRGVGIPVIALGSTGVALLLAGVLVPGMLAPVQRGWMRFAVLLSRVTTPVFMGVVFFGLFTPIGFLMRISGRNPLVRGRAGTAWIERAPGHRASDLQRQF